MMTGLRKLGLSLAALTLVLAQSGAAKPLAARVKQTSRPVAALAMDGPRVAYASGGKIYVWNVDNGTTSVVKGAYSKYAAEVAIAGKRVAWVTRYVVGNTYQTTERLYAGPVGGSARLLRMTRRYAGRHDGEWYGGWIAGAVGSEDVLVVSTWWTKNRTRTGETLNLVEPSGLKSIGGGIVSQSISNGRIAVLRFQGAWPTLGTSPVVEGPLWVGLFSTKGKLLKNFAPSSAKEIALSGDRLVVLTATKTLEIYSTETGKLLHTWPVAASTPGLQAGHLSVCGNLATYSVDPRRAWTRAVHVLRLTDGKDIVVAKARGSGYYNRDAALGPRGLVYSVTYHEHGRLGTPLHGRLVFVPTAKLLAAVAPPRPKTVLAKPPEPRTLVRSSTAIYAFAQSRDALASVAADGRVRVKRISSGRTWVVGRVDPPERARGAVVALAGTRALWAWDSGGNSYETSFATGAPGRRQASFDSLHGGARNFGDGERFSGLAADATTLAFGWADGACADQPYGLCDLCNPLGSCPLVVAGGGVAIVPTQVSRRRPPVIPGVVPPALFAIGGGRVAVVPARSPTPEGDWVPRVAEDGPVEVFDLDGRPLMHVQLIGLVRDVALTGHTLAVLLERPFGEKVVYRYDARNGTYLGGSGPLPLGATDLSASSAGIVFRDGVRIYLVHGWTPRLVARAAARPIGLSIDGRRVAWAESVNGKGRIRGVTLR